MENLDDKNQPEAKQQATLSLATAALLFVGVILAVFGLGGSWGSGLSRTMGLLGIFLVASGIVISLRANRKVSGTKNSHANSSSSLGLVSRMIFSKSDCHLLMSYAKRYAQALNRRHAGFIITLGVLGLGVGVPIGLKMRANSSEQSSQRRLVYEHQKAEEAALARKQGHEAGLYQGINDARKGTPQLSNDQVRNLANYAVKKKGGHPAWAEGFLTGYTEGYVDVYLRGK